MTDKDPKDMTASELVRKASIRETDEWGNITPQVKLFSALSGEDASMTDYVERGDLLRLLADKIDADIAEARKDAIRESKKPMWWFRQAIKCGYDWPEPRDGEKFRDYLHRCFLPRPRFEDGEPVQLGELVDSNLVGAVRVSAIEFTEYETYVKDEPGGDWSTSLEVTTNRLKRPAPEALGADGLPIKAGETVWSLSGTGPHTVDTVYTDIPTPDGRDCPWVDIDNEGTWACAESLTHTPPETQERIDGDAAKDHVEYWRCSGFDCAECPSKIDGEKPWERYECSGACCDHAMMLDLLRRQRELDKQTGGAQ